MISVDRAKTIIAGVVQVLPAQWVPLQQCTGLVLAEQVISPIDIPAYPQSGMDGYALSFESIGSTISVDGEMAAGSSDEMQLQAGQAVRIFTGAAVPPGADTVVMQEKCAVENGTLVIHDTNLKKGDNVRPVGSEIARGAVGLEAASLLTPAAIGFLAGMGMASAKVYPAPRVSIIVTGNELQQPGLPLGYGQVYEANSFALLGALSQLNLQQVPVYRSADDPLQLQDLLSKAMAESDMVLMTGGVSVGDYDFTLGAFDACGVEKLFHKIKQKPGKPILFGMAGNKPVFGLPGNPASVLTCFYQFVIPAIEWLTAQKALVTRTTAPVAQGYKKAAGLTHFLKAYYNGSTVELFAGQESYKLNSFARANCLAVIPEDTVMVEPGDHIQIDLLP